MIPLFVWLAQMPKCFNVFKEYVAENPELFQDTPNLAKDFDSPICLGLHNSQNNTSIFTTAKNLFPTNTMLLKIPNNSSHLAQEDNTSEKMVTLVSFDWFL